MILSNFALTKTIVNSPFDTFLSGEVDVTTTSGYLRWKKTKTERVKIGNRGNGWFFVSNGEYCPHSQITAAERKFIAENQKG